MLVESVEGGSESLESVHDVVGGHGVSARVFGVEVGCAYDGLQVCFESDFGFVDGVYGESGGSGPARAPAYVLLGDAADGVDESSFEPES